MSVGRKMLIQFLEYSISRLIYNIYNKYKDTINKASRLSVECLFLIVCVFAL